jgi:hypothetical protein
MNGEDIVKERCYKFLKTKLKEFGPEIMNNEFQKCLMAEWRRIVSCPVRNQRFDGIRRSHITG